MSHPSVDPMMITELRKIFGARMRLNYSLATPCTFGVGGLADVWVEITSKKELTQLLNLTSVRGCPLTLLGNASNTLFSDAGVRGIVARMRLNKYRLERLSGQQVRVIANAGTNMRWLVNKLESEGIAGLEWGIGVPGTVGGAVVSNAGAYGSCVENSIERAQILRRAADGTFTAVEMTNSQLGFGYRTSRFRFGRETTFDKDSYPIHIKDKPLVPAEIITEVSFLLSFGVADKIHRQIEDYKERRKRTQPDIKGSVGSIFKNPKKNRAGQPIEKKAWELIEAAGLQGQGYGGAQISDLHANFIVNTGDATAEQFVTLIADTRRKVLEQFDIPLELEVELNGDW